MHEIDARNAADYLQAAGRIAAADQVRVAELTGGVSNMVLLVEPAGRPEGRFVLKQARAELRTRQAWFSRLERIWREVEVLETCERLLAESAAIPCAACAGESLPPIGTPQVLFVDRENYLFAMTAAPGTPTVWKTQLLAGVFDETIAAACAHLLATLHGKSWQDPELTPLLSDRSLFDELRIDPYYRTLATVHPPLRPALAQLIASTEVHRLALVHADFSPKNLLVGPAGLMMVDFETGHFGDPAFDLGFFQSHLILKAFYHAPRFDPLLRLSALFWRGYQRHLAPHVAPGELADLERRMAEHFAACALARIDGKSPVDYLDSPRQEAVRNLCLELLIDSPPTWPLALEALCRGIAGGGERALIQRKRKQGNHPQIAQISQIGSRGCVCSRSQGQGGQSHFAPQAAQNWDSPCPFCPQAPSQ